MGLGSWVFGFPFLIVVNVKCLQDDLHRYLLDCIYSDIGKIGDVMQCMKTVLMS